MTITWDWGDGTTTQEGVIAQHTFADYAQQTITATDAQGLTGSVTVTALPLWDTDYWDSTNWGD
jgi:hypothetical protein